MSLPAGSRRRMFFVGAAATLAAGVLLAGLGVASGLYNVAASVDHLRITNVVLEFALRRSVGFHSRGVTVPEGLDDPDLARLGARHFASGCAFCHGAPGAARLPVTGGMYPPPPPLDDAVAEWEDRHLYWIVRHGLKFTGMPQWPGEGRDNEVWPLVAFLKTLPEMTPADYRNAVGLPVESASDGDRASIGCTSCHGDGSRPPVSDLVPPLHGQNEAYLARALREYAEDRRQSGMMEPIAAGLAEDEILSLAREFAASQAPNTSRDNAEVDSRSLARGEKIARRGLREQNVAACLSCHAGEKSSHYPRLEGLSAAYISQQLELFRSGARRGSPYGRTMTAIAERLDDAQIADVAAYLGSASTTDVLAETEATR